MLRSRDVPAPRKRAQLRPQPFLPRRAPRGSVAVGADRVMPAAGLGPRPGQRGSAHRLGACLVRAGTCLGLCSLGACVQQNPFFWAGKQLPHFSFLCSSAHLPCPEPPTSTGGKLQHRPFWPLYPNTFLPTGVSNGEAQPGVSNTPQLPTCTGPWTSGQRTRPRGSKVLQIGRYWELVPQQPPVGSPINIPFTPGSWQCLCFATRFVAESVFCPAGTQSLGRWLCICWRACRAPRQPKPPSFCVSLGDDDAESGKQESDEPDTTDSEVCWLSSVH